MYNKLYTLLVFMVVILSTFTLVSGASPFKTTTTDGCEISPIVRDTLKAGQDFDFNFHVFNASNGIPLSNSTLTCTFHFYNQTGDHVFATILKNDPYSEHFVINEWAERMKGANISKIGTYAYLVQCNGTRMGCADKGSFTVTNSGYEATTGRALFDVGLIIILVSFLFGAIMLFINFDNILNRVGMFGVAYLMLVAITFIAWQMANDFLLSAVFLVEVFRILFIVLMILAFPLLIGAFAWYLIMLFKIKEIERLMTKGMGYDEASRRVK